MAITTRYSLPRVMCQMMPASFEPEWNDQLTEILNLPNCIFIRDDLKGSAEGCLTIPCTIA